MPDEPEVLEHDADAAAELGQAVARGVGQLLAEQPDTAARGALGEVEQLQQRGFAGSGRAGEEVEPPFARRKSRSRSTSAPVP